MWTWLSVFCFLQTIILSFHEDNINDNNGDILKTIPQFRPGKHTETDDVKQKRESRYHKPLELSANSIFHPEVESKQKKDIVAYEKQKLKIIPDKSPSEELNEIFYPRYTHRPPKPKAPVVDEQKFKLGEVEKTTEILQPVVTALPSSPLDDNPHVVPLTEHSVYSEHQQIGARITVRSYLTADMKAAFAEASVQAIVDTGSIFTWIEKSKYSPPESSTPFKNGTNHFTIVYGGTQTVQLEAFKDNITLLRANNKDDSNLIAVDELVGKCLSKGTRDECVPPGMPNVHGLIGLAVANKKYKSIEHANLETTFGYGPSYLDRLKELRRTPEKLFSLSHCENRWYLAFGKNEDIRDQLCMLDKGYTFGVRKQQNEEQAFFWLLSLDKLTVSYPCRKGEFEDGNVEDENATCDALNMERFEFKGVSFNPLLFSIQ